MGYYGSVILLLICLAMIMGIDAKYTPISFILVGIWWSSFSQLTYRVLPDNVYNRKPKLDYVKKGFQELKIVYNEFLKTHRLKRYLQAFPELDKEKFDATYHILAAQRHCKVLGIFSRLHARDNKDNYLTHLPRCWEMLKHSCVNPSLLELRNWLHSNMPSSYF